MEMATTTRNASSCVNKPGHICPNWKQCADNQHNGIFCKNTKGSNVRTGVVNVEPLVQGHRFHVKND